MDVRIVERVDERAVRPENLDQGDAEQGKGDQRGDDAGRVRPGRRRSWQV